MKTDSIMNKIRDYLRELTIVIIGVLIALIISNFKENNQAKKYQIASIETIKKEVTANYSDLKGVMEKQTRLLDTIKKYSNDHIPIGNLISKSGGIQIAPLSNTGLEFYTRNQINSIDFEIMSMLIRMNSLSELIDNNMEKLRDYLYPNLFADSEKSKMLFAMYLSNVLESETQLIHTYENFNEDYIKTTHNIGS
ncbi:MAG: hypothetical protein IMY72_02035 [Bacteroidetes bacterium]|nr:hypothetical protein [Bacteroidota bacterium]